MSMRPLRLVAKGINTYRFPRCSVLTHESKRTVGLRSPDLIPHEQTPTVPEAALERWVRSRAAPDSGHHSNRERQDDGKCGSVLLSTIARVDRSLLQNLHHQAIV